MTAFSTSVIAPVGLPRLLASPPTPGLDSHLQALGPLPRGDGLLIAEVKRAGLRGRGGGGFPTGIKMEAVAARRRSVVVVNGSEGEPVSTKDVTLLAYAPHLVLDGAVAAAEAVGAREVLVCVERQALACVAAVDRALDERRAAGMDRVAVKLATVPARYLSGEESALVHWLNGGEMKPTFTPPRPYERGVNGRPTLVQNVETLAHVGLIARFGADWYRQMGTAVDSGSALVTVSGGVARPGVYEVPYGITFDAILQAAGTRPDQLGALLVGGCFGTWVPASAVEGLRFSSEALAPLGARLGCGAIVALPRTACGLVESARVTRWLASQSAGQCGPCVNGLGAIAKAFDKVVAGDRDGRALRLLQRWLPMVKGRGACSMPDGTAGFVESSLRVFGSEIERHRQRGPVPLGTGDTASGPRGLAVRRPRLQLVVNPITCTGHGLCAELLPEWITLDDWGYPVVRAGALPPELVGHARRAVAACPTLALLLREDLAPAVAR